MASRRRNRRRWRPAASRWRRLCIEFFEPRQLLAPVAVADSYSTPEDTLLTITAPGILSNDTGGPTSALLATGPSRGTLSLNANGGFTYTPNANLFGPDSFTYRASDRTTTSDLTAVSLNVTPVNDPPVAINDTFSTPGAPLTIPSPGVLANDIDFETPVTFLTAALLEPPLQGTLSLNPNGSFNYVPPICFHGSASFTYRASDGQLQSNIATVVINVDGHGASPPAANNDSYTVQEDALLNVPAPGVLGNDTGVSACFPLTAVPIANPSRGTLTLNSNGSFTYTPRSDFHGTDSFVYLAFDGVYGSNTATVTISVTPINDAPVAVNNAYSASEDTSLTIAAPGILANDTDIDTPPVLFTAQLETNVPPTAGTLSPITNGGFTFTPSPNFNGLTSFTYRVNDGQLQSQNLATVTITVTPVNDAPFAVNDTYTTHEGVLLNVGPPGVLANDVDVENDALTAVLVAGPGHGMLTLNPNGSFLYTPTRDCIEVDSFTYRANDSSPSSNVATVSIRIQPSSAPPFAVNDAYNATEDAPLTISAAQGVLKNDGCDLLYALIVTGPAHGMLILNANGSFTYTPNPNFNGTDSFTYRASDGQVQSNTATVTINIAPVNDSPVAVNDTYIRTPGLPFTIGNPGVVGNDIDVDGDVLTASLVTGPAGGTLTLNAAGGFTYTPSPADCIIITASFTYRVADAAGLISNTATVIFNATLAPNQPPVALHDNYSVNEDAQLNITAPGVLRNDTDVDSCDQLTASLVTTPTHGTLSLAVNGSFTYTPNPNYFGLDSFTYRANDGFYLSNLATVTINVAAVPDAPVVVNDRYTTAENRPLVITAPGVLANDFDADGDLLTAVFVSGPTHGTLTFNVNGSFTYTPEFNYFGPDIFTYRARDGALLSNLAMVSIDVQWSQCHCVAANDSYTLSEDVPLIVSAPGVLANDADVDWNELAAIFITAPARGTLILNANGSFAYIPNANFNGTDSFTYIARDQIYDSNLATVTINVTAVNDPPVAQNDVYGALENGSLVVPATGGLLINDSDLDGQLITAQLVTPAAYGTVALAANGGFTYTPNQNFIGLESFTYRANDGSTSSDLATAVISVNACSDAPIEIGVDPTVNDDGGPQLIPNWVSNFVVYTPSYQVTTDKPEFFTVPPAVSSTGTLTFTPARNVRGTAALTVGILYSAGFATGCADQFQFSITINKPNPWHNTTILPAPKSGGLDVNADGHISAIDAVLVINYLNGSQPTTIPLSAPIGGPAGIGPGIAGFLDTGGGPNGQGDNFISPLDAILVINWLNAHPPVVPPAANPPPAGGEGERDDLQLNASLLDLLALDLVTQTKRRRSASA
jgi:VCBS repeat-containing protein